MEEDVLWNQIQFWDMVLQYILQYNNILIRLPDIQLNDLVKQEQCTEEEVVRDQIKFRDCKVNLTNIYYDKVSINS